MWSHNPSFYNGGGKWVLSLFWLPVWHGWQCCLCRLSSGVQLPFSVSAPVMRMCAKSKSLNSRLANNLTGITTIKSFTAENYEAARLAVDSQRASNRRAIALLQCCLCILIRAWRVSLHCCCMATVAGRMSVGTWCVSVPDPTVALAFDEGWEKARPISTSNGFC